MSETFQVKEACHNLDQFVSWALINLISQKTSEFFPEQVIRVNDKKELVVELKINGIEVSFKDMCERLAEARETDIKRSAMALIRDKVGNTMDVLHDIERKVIDIAKTELDMFEED